MSADLRRVIRQLPAGSWVDATTFAGDASGAACADAVRAGELIDVAAGLWWRGSRTRFGMTRPSEISFGVRLAGPGSGPAGFAAANLLAVSTQVPAVIRMAAPGVLPEDRPTIRFEPRPASRAARVLQPVEVAVVELCQNPDLADGTWHSTAAQLAALVTTGAVRAHIIADQIRDEDSGTGAWDAVGASA